MGAMFGPISGRHLVDLIGFDMAAFLNAILFILTVILALFLISTSVQKFNNL